MKFYSFLHCVVFSSVTQRAAATPGRPLLHSEHYSRVKSSHVNHRDQVRDPNRDVHILCTVSIIMC